MRSHGVSDFPDPTIGSNGLPNWTSPTTEAPAQQAAQPTAQKACKKDLPDFQTSAEKATASAAALKYATCMRSNGVSEFPDPNGQGVIQVNSSTDIDQSSPAFQKAEAACKSLDNGFGESAASASAAPGGAGSGS